MTYEIRNYRSLSSGAYTASLWKDGKRVATIEDDGRGGEPNVYPTSRTAPMWAAREVLLNELTAWAKESLPEWYLTSHGTFPTALTANWELGIGYLTESAELNRIGKGKKVILRDGQVYTMAQHGRHKSTDRVWNGSDWITAAI